MDHGDIPRHLCLVLLRPNKLVPETQIHPVGPRPIPRPQTVREFRRITDVRANKEIVYRTTPRGGCDIVGTTGYTVQLCQIVELCFALPEAREVGIVGLGLRVNTASEMNKLLPQRNSRSVQCRLRYYVSSHI